jgi:hypothetical protein
VLVVCAAARQLRWRLPKFDHFIVKDALVPSDLRYDRLHSSFGQMCFHVSPAALTQARGFAASKMLSSRAKD